MWTHVTEGRRSLGADDIAAVRSLYGGGGGGGGGGDLGVSFTENPFACDGGTRSFGQVSGAAAGEQITFTSPPSSERSYLERRTAVVC